MGELMKENFTFSFDGEALETHEIDAAVLADSLLALHGLIEKTNTLQNGKNTELYLKVKAGFKKGSFEISLVLEWVKNNPDGAAALIGVAGGTLTACVSGVIKLFKFAKGKKVEAKQIDANDTKITNSNGETKIFNNCVFGMYNDVGIKSSLHKVTAPLNRPGLNSIGIKTEEDEESVTISKNEKEYFEISPAELLTENEELRILEIRTSNLDGKSSGWRFYDGDAEYQASIEDDVFLKDVREGTYKFSNGDMIEARLKTIQKRASKRLVMSRIILEVISFIPHEEMDSEG